MAYNTNLEKMIDHLLGGDKNLEKKKMFGGVGYLLHGNICFGIHKDDLILRTTGENADELLGEKGFKPFDITGAAMKGWVMAEPPVYQQKERLEELLDEGIRFASTLQKK